MNRYDIALKRPIPVPIPVDPSAEVFNLGYMGVDFENHWVSNGAVNTAVVIAHYTEEHQIMVNHTNLWHCRDFQHLSDRIQKLFKDFPIKYGAINKINFSDTVFYIGDVKFSMVGNNKRNNGIVPEMNGIFYHNSDKLYFSDDPDSRINDIELFRKETNLKRALLRATYLLVKDISGELK